MKSKLIVTACGGAGISIADKVINKLCELGDGFAEVNTMYIDTATNNIEKIEHDRNNFWLVKAKGFNSTNISGSGGERRTNADDIMANVKEYLDHFKLLKKVTNEYHAVIFSASGGSGSVIGPAVIKNFLERNIPVFAVMVGDSSNGLAAINTQNTISTLDSISKLTNKPLMVIYSNNQAFADKGLMEAEKKVNRILFNTLSTLSLFLSGVNEALDFKDMEGFIDQSHFRTLNVKPGLYGLSIHSKDVSIPKDSMPIIARTLTLDNLPSDINIETGHHKVGFVTSENAINIYKDQFPLHAITLSNYFNSEVTTLKRITDNHYNVMDNIQNSTIISSARSEASDDGFVF